MKKWIALVLSIVLVLSLAACGGTTGGDKETEASASRILDNGRYDKVIMALQEGPEDLEPDGYNGGPRFNWISLVYETLFDNEIGLGQGFRPCIAESYEEVDGGKAWLIKIRDGVKDWNGNAITANDVKYSYDYLVNTGNTIRFNLYDGIEAVDDSHVKISFNDVPKALNDLEFIMTRTIIFSQKSYEEKGDAGFAKECVGTGCMKVKEYVNGSKLVLEANDDYWGLGLEGLSQCHVATVQEIELQTVAEAATAAIGLENGTIDFCSYIQLAMVDEFQEGGKYADKYNTEILVQGDYWVIIPNVTTTDANLRIAAFYAMDKAAIAKAMGGQYVPSDTLGNSSFVDYDESLVMKDTYFTDYDPEKAKEYLAKSDYKGETLSIVCGTSEADKQAATMLQTLWEQVGIKSEINALSNDMKRTTTDDPTAWEFQLNCIGGPNMVGSWGMTLNDESRQGKTNGYIDDPKLKELVGAAMSDATHDAEHMRATLDYAVEQGYVQSMVNTSTALVYTKDCAEIYYREGYFMPASSKFVGQ